MLESFNPKDYNWTYRPKEQRLEGVPKENMMFTGILAKSGALSRRIGQEFGERAECTGPFEDKHRDPITGTFEKIPVAPQEEDSQPASYRLIVKNVTPRDCRTLLGSTSFMITDAPQQSPILQRA